MSDSKQVLNLTTLFNEKKPAKPNRNEGIKRSFGEGLFHIQVVNIIQKFLLKNYSVDPQLMFVKVFEIWTNQILPHILNTIFPHNI